jgi:hypothetical protein
LFSVFDFQLGRCGGTRRNEMDPVTLQLISEGIDLTEEFAPTAVKLIKDLFTSLAGKTEEQVLADAETNFAAIHAKAVAEQA